MNTFRLIVEDGHAALFDAEASYHEPPIAEATAMSNDEAVAALFASITIPDESDTQTN